MVEATPVSVYDRHPGGEHHGLIPFLNRHESPGTESAIISALEDAGYYSKLTPFTPDQDWGWQRVDHTVGTVDLTGPNLPTKIFIETGADDTLTLVDHGNVLFATGDGNNIDVKIQNTYGDTLVGGTGNDTLSDSGGPNLLIAGSGNSVLIAGSGKDTLIGGSGDDTLTGGGLTLMEAGSGATVMNGGLTSGAEDTLKGGSGPDTITVTAGHNKIYGGTGNETITGGSGNDTIYGGTGADSITTGSGTQYVKTGTGHETIDATHGADSIYVGYQGGGGVDSIHGSSSTQVFIDVKANDPTLSITHLGTGANAYQQITFGTGSAKTTVDVSGTTHITYTTATPPV